MLKFDRTRWRQMLFPAEFRLPEPDFKEDQLDLLEELIQLIQPNIEEMESDGLDEKLQMARFLIQLATGVWRARRRIEGLKRMPKELKEALFSLESIWASMAEGGISIVDHVGEVPSGSVPRIVEVRLVPGLAREEVVETILPSILLHGEVIQVGEVILGRPAPVVEEVSADA